MIKVRFLFDSAIGSRMLCEPITLGTAALSGGLSIGNTLLGNLLGRSNTEYAMEKQKEMMKYQWDNFASPKAQLASYAQAGLNPAVAMGQSAPSISVPDGGNPHVSPVDIGLSGNDLTNSILALSQAKKAGAETAAQELENYINKSVVDERIKKYALDNNLSRQNFEFLEKQISNIEGQNTKLQEEINVLRKQGVEMDFNNSKLKERFDVEMRKYADEHNINKQTYDQMVEQAPVILEKLKAEKRILDVDAEISEDFKETQANLGVLGQVLKFVSSFVKMMK